MTVAKRAGAFGRRRLGDCPKTGKRSYGGPAGADIHAYALAIHDERSRILGVYRCPHCHSWHVGHNRRIDQ